MKNKRRYHKRYASSLKKLPPGLVRDVKTALGRGIPLYRVAVRYGVNPGLVYATARRLGGVLPRGAGRWPGLGPQAEAKALKINRLRLKGLTYLAIADQVGGTKAGVWQLHKRWLTHSGWKARK